MALRRRKAATAVRVGLEPQWMACLAEAWSAYRAGTIPLGAVVTDSRGAIVARGRDRTYDLAGPTARLSGTPVAHAAIDALAALAPDRRYDDHTLWTSVEPCLLCHGAAVTATVGSIRYASADPYAGTAHVTVTNPHVARRPLDIEGPLPGTAGMIGAVLRLELYLRANPTGAVVETYRTHAPLVLAAAERLRADDVLADAARRGVSFSSLAPHLVAELEEH